MSLCKGRIYEVPDVPETTRAYVAISLGPNPRVILKGKALPEVGPDVRDGETEKRFETVVELGTGRCDSNNDAMARRLGVARRKNLCLRICRRRLRLTPTLEIRPRLNLNFIWQRTRKSSIRLPSNEAEVLK